MRILGLCTPRSGLEWKWLCWANYTIGLHQGSFCRVKLHEGFAGLNSPLPWEGLWEGLGIGRQEGTIWAGDYFQSPSPLHETALLHPWWCLPAMAYGNLSLGFLNNKLVLSENLGNNYFRSCDGLPRPQLGGWRWGPCIQSCPTLNHSSQTTAAAGLSFFQGYTCEGVPLSQSQVLFCMSAAQVLLQGHMPAGTLNCPWTALQSCMVCPGMA